MDHTDSARVLELLLEHDRASQPDEGAGKTLTLTLTLTLTRTRTLSLTLTLTLSLSLTLTRWGPCSTYAEGQANRDYCTMDAVDRLFAIDVCPQCGGCSTSA